LFANPNINGTERDIEEHGHNKWNDDGKHSSLGEGILKKRLDGPNKTNPRIPSFPWAAFV
jgi:hypothetical protein